MRRILAAAILMVTLLTAGTGTAAFAVDSTSAAAGTTSILSAKASAGWVYSGSSSRVSGTLAVAAGHSPSGQLLVLYARAPGGSWSKAAVVRTTTGGVYHFDPVIRFNTQMQVRYGGTPGVQAALSNIVSISARPQILQNTVTAPAGTPRLGQVNTWAVLLAPWFYNQVVQVQLHLPAGVWQTQASARVATTGSVTVRFRLTTVGTSTFRLLIPATRTYLAVFTTSRSFTVPAPAPPTSGGGAPPRPADRNCSVFATHAAAQAFYLYYYPYYGDFSHLDADHDGVACETLP